MDNERKNTIKQKLHDVPKFSNFREMINNSAKVYGNKNAFQIKIGKEAYRYITYLELEKLYYNLCAQFIDMGLLGKRIAVVGKNCFEWVLCYLAASTIGTIVPIDKELSAEDIHDFITASESLAIVGDEAIIEKMNKTFDTSLKFYTFADVNKMSNVDCGSKKEEVDSIQFRDDEMRILIFTSGTTGSSKGVCLSHKNICTNIHSTSQIVNVKQTDHTLSVLPLHHTYECTLDCMLLLSRGACISYCDSLAKIPQNMLEYKPTLLVVVPALLNVLIKRISKAISLDCPPKYKPLYENKSLGQALKETPFIIRKVITSKVKKNFGGKLRLIIVGAADIEPSLIEDFLALGIRTLQGYGLTECSPLVAGNSDFYLNPSSTGRAIPGVTMKIVNPNESGIGEIAVSGENVMLEYFNDPVATDNVIKDGFFHTGDLGFIDEAGDLYIKGRIKNIIVTSNGRNIYPEEIETRLLQIPVISEALVFAYDDNGEVSVKAKVFPNLDYIKEKLGNIPGPEEIKAAVNNAIKEVNSRIPSYKHIRIVEILANELEKTTTRKIKRFGSNLG